MNILKLRISDTLFYIHKQAMILKVEISRQSLTFEMSSEIESVLYRHSSGLFGMGKAQAHTSMSSSGNVFYRDKIYLLQMCQLLTIEYNNTL